MGKFDRAAQARLDAFVCAALAGRSSSPQQDPGNTESAQAKDAINIAKATIAELDRLAALERGKDRDD